MDYALSGITVVILVTTIWTMAKVDRLNSHTRRIIEASRAARAREFLQTSRAPADGNTEHAGYPENSEEGLNK